MMEQEYEMEKITYKEAAFLLGISTCYLYELVAQGKLTPQRPRGRRPYFTKEYISKVLKDGYDY